MQPPTGYTLLICYPPVAADPGRLFGCVRITVLLATAVTPKSVGVFDLAERILLHAEVMAKLVKERVTNLGE